MPEMTELFESPSRRLGSHVKCFRLLAKNLPTPMVCGLSRARARNGDGSGHGYERIYLAMATKAGGGWLVMMRRGGGPDANSASQPPEPLGSSGQGTDAGSGVGRGASASPGPGRSLGQREGRLLTLGAHRLLTACRARPPEAGTPLVTYRRRPTHLSPRAVEPGGASRRPVLWVRSIRRAGGWSCPSLRGVPVARRLGEGDGASPSCPRPAARRE